MNNKVTLYIVTHNKTGFKYFGKTIRWFTVEDLQKYYKGSGVWWLRHLNKHGNDISFEIYKICSLDENAEDYVVPIALKFSTENDIIGRDNNWANLMLENGLDGGCDKGRILSEEHKQKISLAHKSRVGSSMSGKTQTDFQKQRASETHKGKTLSEESKKKISIKNSGKIMSDETRKKMSNSKKGIPKPKITCPHCNKTGGTPQMKRYHFDNCKDIIDARAA